MQGLVEYIGNRRLFDHSAEVHDRDPVADMPDHAQVMRDKQETQAMSGAKTIQQFEDLGLHRNIQGRNRLIGNDESRRQNQRPGDTDALSLPAREFMRIASR